MKNFLARTAYWMSKGWDNSEYPEAGRREKERLRKLKNRIGAKEFKKFNSDDSGALRDPAFFIGALPPFVVVGWIVIAVILFLK